MTHMLQRILLLGLALGAGAPSLAQIDIAPLNGTLTVNWVAGDVVAQQSYCVESFQEAPDKKSSNPIPYSISASIGGGTAPFTLANAAGQTIPVAISWTDTDAGTTTTLAPGVATANTLTGHLAACPGGNNGLATITVLNSDLGAAAAGTYTRAFTLEATNQGSGRSRRAATYTLSVVVPAVIRISDVNDLVLGTFDGVADLVASDTVCIYKNGGAFYGITATGNGTDPVSGVTGQFRVANGAVSAPYTVSWQDNLGTIPLTSGVQAANRGNANTTSTTCGGTGNNATITVTIPAADLLGAMQPGLYSGVLTLMVIPQ